MDEVIQEPSEEIVDEIHEVFDKPKHPGGAPRKPEFDKMDPKLELLYKIQRLTRRNTTVRPGIMKLLQIEACLLGINIDEPVEQLVSESGKPEVVKVHDPLEDV